MRNFITIAFIAVAGTAGAQVDSTSTIDLDIMRAPGSPGSVLLGFSEGDIQRPTDVKEFVLSLGQASNDFASAPTSYAIDISPSQLFNSDRSASALLGIDGNGDEEEAELPRTVWESLILSMAYKGTADDNDGDFDPRSGFGFRVSLIQGGLTQESINSFMGLKESLLDYNKAVHDDVDTALSEDELLLSLNENLRATIERISNIRGELNSENIDEALKKQLADSLGLLLLQKVDLAGKIAQRAVEVASSIPAQIATTRERFKVLKDATENYKISRVGHFLDLAGGLALDFRNRQFDNSELSKFGVWLTYSHENGKGLSKQVMIRMLSETLNSFSEDTERLDEETVVNLDVGGRLTFEPVNGRFALSCEGLYRAESGTSNSNATWRLVANTQYSLSSKQMLTFSFGRDFDGSTSKEGNLVAALNLLFALGGKSTIN